MSRESRVQSSPGVYSRTDVRVVKERVLRFTVRFTERTLGEIRRGFKPHSVQSNSLSMEWFVCDMYTEGKVQ